MLLKRLLSLVRDTLIILNNDIRVDPPYSEKRLRIVVKGKNRSILCVHKKKDSWYITNIRAIPRDKGIGSFMLRRLLSIADRQGVNVELSVDPPNKRDFDRLKRWYISHGFVSQEGDRMIRYCKKRSAEHSSRANIGGKS